MEEDSGLSKNERRRLRRERRREERRQQYEKGKKKGKMTTILIIIVIIAVIGGAAYGFSGIFSSVSDINAGTLLGPVGSTHQHSAFAVYLEGQKIDFSQNKYQVKSQHVHVEGGDGTTIHKHATGATLGFFFNSLGMKFNSTCFILDSGQSFCNEGNKTLKFFVNGEPSQDSEAHELQDSEKYLISYGDETDEEIQSQIDSIGPPNISPDSIPRGSHG